MSNQLHRLLISNSHDPWFNLAVEEAIFNGLGNKQILFLWRNNNTVVIGRAQNPWKECNTKKMEEDGIKLARRTSGGGAVFHDLGNTCFTFMAPKPGYDKTVSTQIILKALDLLGVEAEASGRNDVIVKTQEGERKISGSAYKETPDRGFHHGTLLVNANLNRLADYLNPDIKKLEAKGISSVRSRVMNLVEISPDMTHDLICEAIIKAYFEHYQIEIEPEYISKDNMPDMPQFQAILEKQSSWNWNFGRAPEFSHHLDARFKWGGVDIYLNIINGSIINAQIFTDSLFIAPLQRLEKHMVGVNYNPDAIYNLCQRLMLDTPDFNIELEEISAWLIDAIR